MLPKLLISKLGLKSTIVLKAKNLGGKVSGKIRGRCYHLGKNT